LLTQPGHKRPLEVAKHPAILAKLTAAELACKKQKELGEWLASIGLEKYLLQMQLLPFVWLTEIPPGICQPL
jgi:hypothetical protein